jgi:TolA-binding protein
VKRLLVLIALALSVPAYAQVTCQTGPYNRYAGGSTTTCNGSLATPPATLPVQPMQNYGAMMSSTTQAQAVQTAANAQMLQVQVQARLAQQQADLMSQQTEALQRQQVHEQSDALATQRTQAQRETSAPSERPQSPGFAPLTEQERQRARDVEARIEARMVREQSGSAPATHEPVSAELEQLHVKMAEPVRNSTTTKLYAVAATLEATQRNSPAGSTTFNNATQALEAVNEELAIRGALK